MSARLRSRHSKLWRYLDSTGKSGAAAAVVVVVVVVRGGGEDEGEDVGDDGEGGDSGGVLSTSRAGSFGDVKVE